MQQNFFLKSNMPIKSKHIGCIFYLLKGNLLMLELGGKNTVKKLIAQELSSPSEFRVPNPYTREQRAGIDSPQFDFKQLYQSLIAEKSLQEQVELAYKLILKRPADREGSLTHQETLKDGGVIALIARLRYSEEGRKAKTPIKGLMGPYIKFRLRHWLLKSTK